MSKITLIYHIDCLSINYNGEKIEEVIAIFLDRMKNCRSYYLFTSLEKIAIHLEYLAFFGGMLENVLESRHPRGGVEFTLSFDSNECVSDLRNIYASKKYVTVK